MSEDLYTLSEPGESEAQQSAGPLALDVKRLIALRLPLMIIIFVVCAIPASILAWYTRPVVYTATAEVRFRSYIPRIIPEGNSGNSSSYDNFVNTQIGLITGPTVLSKVVDRLDVDQLVSLRDAGDPVKVLESAVSARIRGRSELVTIQCTLPVAEEAQLVLNTLLTTYLEFAVSESAEIDSDRLKALLGERSTMQAQLDAVVANIANKERSLGIATVGVESPDAIKLSQYREKLLNVEERNSALQALQRERESNVAAIEALMAGYQEDPDAPISERGVEARVAADPDVAAYRSRLFAAEERLSQVKETYRPAHPSYEEAEKQVELREAEMLRYKREARRRVLTSMVAEAQFQLEQANSDVEEGQLRVQEYETQLADIETEMNSTMDEKSRQLSDLNELKQNASDTRGRLSMLSRRIDDIQREEKAPARITKSSDARVPTKPNYKKHFMMVIMALVASAGLGVGVGVARELTDNQLRSSRDVTRLTRLPVIASIPHADEDEFLQAAHVPLLTMDHPSSMAADEYRRILSRILYPPEETTEVNSILVASPSSGDGKTSLCCNLAIALSQAHRQVLLVDISSQQPAIEACFGLSASNGLAELLRAELSAQQCLRGTEYDGLCVMGPGLRTQDLASRLASRRMTEFLEWAEHEYDHVIFDTPPALLMSDSKLLAPLTDGVIMVIGAGVSSNGMVRRCLLEMEQLKANVLGVVLNGIRGMRGGYLSNRRKLFYAYYHGNGHEESDLPEMEVVADDDDMEPVVVLLPTEQDEKAFGGARNDRS